MSTQKNNSPTAKNKPYVFVQREQDDFSCIKLTDGKFKDIIFHYGKVGFAKDPNPDGTLPMKFDYTIKQNPNNLDLNENQDFLNYIGDLLIEILEQQLKDGTAVIS